MAAVALTSSFFLPSVGLAAESALIDAYEYNYIAVAGSYDVNPFGNNNDIKVENGERYVNVNINGTNYKYVYTMVDKDGVFDNNSNDDVGYWIRDGFGVKAITERYHPTATDVRLDLYKIPGTNANYDYISMSGAHTAEPTKITTANNGEALDEFSYIQYAAITNSGGINTPSEWEYYVMQNDKYVNVGGNNFNKNFYEFKATEFNATTGKYTFKGKDVEYENVYRVGNKIGVFLTKAANNASTAQSSYDINAEVYGGSVFGKNNEILLSGYDAKTNTWSTVWAGEVTDPYATVESMTLSEFNEILHHLHKENVKLANADIVGIKAGGSTNSGTLNLINKANNLSNGLTINSVGGTAGTDTRLVFTASGSYVDDDGATQNYNNSFTLDTGSKVVANNGQAYTTNQKLEKLTINGNTYVVSGSTGGGTTTVSNITLTAGNNISISGTTENGTTNYTVTATDTDTTYEIVAGVTDSNGRTQYTLMDVSKNSSEGIFYDTNTDTNTLYAVSDGVYNSDAGETYYTFSGDNGFNKTIIDKNNYVTGATIQNGNLVLERLGMADITVSLNGLGSGLSTTDFKLIANPSGGAYTVNSNGDVTLKVSDGTNINNVLISGLASKSDIGAAKTEVKGIGNVTVNSGDGSNGQTIYTVSVTDTVTNIEAGTNVTIGSPTIDSYGNKTYTISATDTNTTYTVNEGNGSAPGQKTIYTITGTDSSNSIGTIIDTDTVTSLVAGGNINISNPTTDSDGNRTYTISAVDTNTTYTVAKGNGTEPGQKNIYTITGTDSSTGTIIDTDTVTSLVAGNNISISQPTIDSASGNTVYTVTATDTTLKNVTTDKLTNGGTKFTIYDTSNKSVVLDNIATISDISAYSMAVRTISSGVHALELFKDSSVVSSIGVTSVGGTNGQDLKLQFSNIDGNANSSGAFDLPAGSVVAPVLTSTDVSTGTTLNGLTINGKLYNFNATSVSSGASTIGLHEGQASIIKGDEIHGWHAFDTTIKNDITGNTLQFTDTMLVRGVVGPATGTIANSFKYTIYDTAGNAVILDGIASASYVNTQISDINNEITSLNASDIDSIVIDTSISNNTTTNTIGLLRNGTSSNNYVDGTLQIIRTGGTEGIGDDVKVKISNETNNDGIVLTTGSVVGANLNNGVVESISINGKQYNLLTLNGVTGALNDFRLKNGTTSLASYTNTNDNRTGYVVDADGVVALNVVDKNLNHYETVYIANVARASDIGKVENIVVNSSTAVPNPNNIVSHINNIYSSINNINSTNSDWRLVGAAVTDTNETIVNYNGAYEVANDKVTLNVQNQMSGAVENVTINNVAKASDVGNINNITEVLDNNTTNNVVNHINNIYSEINTINSNNSDWRLVGAKVTDTNGTIVNYDGVYEVIDNKVTLNVQNQMNGAVETITIENVAKASDIGDMTIIENNLVNGDENNVVNHLSNLYQKVATEAAKDVIVESVDGNINVIPASNNSGGTTYGVSLSANVNVRNSITVGNSSGTNIVLNGSDASIVSHSVTADVIEAKQHFDVGDVRINSSEIIGLDNTEWDSSVTYTGGKAATQEQLQVVDGKVINVEAKVDKNTTTLEEHKTDINKLYANDQYFASAIDKSNQYLDSRINQLGSKVNKVGAGAAALAALHPMDFDPDDKLSFAVGAGNYAGENATALGAFYRPNEKVMMNVAGTYGNGENMVNMGVSFALDRTNNVSNSRTAMAKEIVDLREQVATQGQQIAQLVALVQQLAGVQQPVVPAEQLFPDVPENHWAYEYVNRLIAKGIIEGYPDGTFGGDRAMTRYEFAAMLFRAMEQGVVINEQVRQEFEKELGRVRVDRVKGADNDPNKIERVRVNKAADRDNYGSKIVQVKH